MRWAGVPVARNELWGKQLVLPGGSTFWIEARLQQYIEQRRRMVEEKDGGLVFEYDVTRSK